MLTALTTSPVARRATEALRADPKKFGALGVLLLVFLTLFGRMMLSGTTAPATAGASVTPPTGAPASGPPAGRAGRATAGGSSAGAGALPDPAPASLQEWARQPIAPIGRNLFAVKLDYYPQDGSTAKITLRAPQGDGFWDKLAKSMAAKADQRKERQILVENLQLQAMQLRLQSTVMGATPRALINGTMVGEGDVVASFRVLRVEPRRIIVEREGIKLEIPMK